MLNKSLERYKELYSEYISYAVTVHNYHNVFVNHVGKESGTLIRTSLAKMINIERALRQASRDAYLEHVENTKEERKRLKELRAKAKKRDMPKNRKGGPEWKPQTKSNNNTKTS